MDTYFEIRMFNFVVIIGGVLCVSVTRKESSETSTRVDILVMLRTCQKHNFSPVGAIPSVKVSRDTM